MRKLGNVPTNNRIPLGQGIDTIKETLLLFKPIASFSTYSKLYKQIFILFYYFKSIVSVYFIAPVKCVQNKNSYIKKSNKSGEPEPYK